MENQLHHQDHHHRQDQISAESLPLIDIRFLSQQELLSLSSSSSSFASSSSSASLADQNDDVLTPKIDRSVFNESAGSRKQTFYRIRLSRHPQPPSPPPRPSNDSSSFSREEKSQILSLFRSLFSLDPVVETIEEEEEEEIYEVEEGEEARRRLFPVPIECTNEVDPDLNLSVPIQVVSGSEMKRKSGRPPKNGNLRDLVVDESRKCEGENNVMHFVNQNDEMVDSMVLESKNEWLGFLNDCNLGVNAVEMKRKRGRPRKDGGENNTAVESVALAMAEELRNEFLEFSSDFSVSVNGSETKRKKGRPRKNIESNDFVMERVKCEEEGAVIGLVNRDGALVDLAALANAEDPYGEELRRRTEGMETKEELLGFLSGLRGGWVSIRKKRKVVDACDFGDALPVGWKLMLCVKQKAGRVWLACRRYISPNGRQFASCNEVSTYLLPFLESQGVNRPNTDYVNGNVPLPPGNLSECQTVQSLPLLAVSGTEMKGETEDPHKDGNLSGWIIESGKSKEREVVDLVNREGTEVHLADLANAEVLYGEELRRMTPGLEMAGQLLGFWSG